MRAYSWLWIVGLIFLLLGLFRDETWNIFINARMLCFSCIGLE